MDSNVPEQTPTWIPCFSQKSEYVCFKDAPARDDLRTALGLHLSLLGQEIWPLPFW
jgi:hypothetical protein